MLFPKAFSTPASSPVSSLFACAALVACVLGGATTALKAQLTYSPTTVTFAPTPIGSTSAVQTFTVTNTSSSSVTPSAATVSANFAVASTPANTCSNMPVASGGTCSISVDFVPTATGTLTGTISLTASGTAYTAALSGVGMLPLPAATTFAASNVGGTAETATVTFTFPATATLSSVQVLTQGATGLDFTAGTQASSGACKAATFTQSGTSTATTCTVVVKFIPTVPGRRLGSVTLYDNESTPLSIGTAYLAGQGNGPQALFSNGVVTTLSSSFASPRGPSIDGLGNIFVANPGNNQVDYFPTGSGSPVVLLNVYAVGTTVDGAGNLYYVNNNNTVWEIPAGTFATTAAGTTNPVLIASIPISENVLLTDSAGNIFAPGGGNIYEIAAGTRAVTTVYTAGTVPSGGVASGNRLIGVALDAANNIYAADFVNNQIFEIAAGTYAATELITPDGNLNGPHGMEIDPAGDLYVTNYSNGATFRYTKNVNGSYTATNLNISAGTGIARAGNGNLVFTSENSVLLDTRTTTAPLAFGSAVVGSTSSAQTVSFENDGNTSAGLTLPAPVVSSGYTVSNNTCANPLPSGVLCTTAVEFTPTTTGTLTGTLTYTDNTLNVTGSTQVVSLSGTSNYSLVFTTAPPASLQTGQNAGTVVAALENSNGSVNTSAPATSITLTVTGPTGYTTTMTSGTTVNGSVSFNLPTALTIPGGYNYVLSDPNGDPAASVTETVYPYKLAYMTPPATPITAGGNAGTVTVAIQDNSGNSTTQTTPVTLSVSGPNSYTASYPSVSPVNGTATFNLTGTALTASGTYSYTATGTGLTSAGAGETVNVAPASTYTVTPANATAIVNYPDNVTVKAYDMYGNLATNYAGTVMLSSTDPGPATLPAPFTLSSGTATKAVTFNTTTTTGWTVTAKDTVTSSLTATSSAITVQPVPVFTVTASTDTNPGTAGNCTNQALSGATLDASCALHDAFAAANAVNITGVTSVPPTINFSATLVAAHPILTIGSVITPTANFKLVGPGAASLTISPTATGFSLINTTAASIAMTVSGLTISGFSRSSVNGGAWWATGSGHVSTFTNDVFTANSVSGTYDGGAVYEASSSAVNITGSTFTGNSGYIGGAVALQGVTQSTIGTSAFGSTSSSAASQNTATSSGGSLYASSGSVTITGSTFSGNGTTTNAPYGGAAYVVNCTCTLTNNAFTSNTATSGGGALYVNVVVGAASTTGTSSSGNIFSGNQVTNQIATGAAGGGAILFNGSGAINVNHVLTNSLFSGNTVAGTYATGGAISLYVGSYFPNVTITNSLFTGNKATASQYYAYGGAIYQSNPTSTSFNSTLTLTGDTFTGNSATGSASSYFDYGGAIFTTSYDHDVFYNDTVTANQAQNTSAAANYALGGGISSACSLPAYCPVLYNTIVAANTTLSNSMASTYPDLSYNNPAFSNASCASPVCNSALTAGGTSVDTGILLSALGNYGGTTIGPVGATVVPGSYAAANGQLILQSIVPLPASPALRAGSTSYIYPTLTTAPYYSTCSGVNTATDNRGCGYPRAGTYNGTYVDAGATEPNYTLSFMTQPVVTNVNTALLPPPTVQLYESGVPFGVTGGTLNLAASAGLTATTAATTASGLVPLAPTFTAPQTNDALIVSVQNSTGTVAASATSNPFNIGTGGTKTITFTQPASPANAGTSATLVASASNGDPVTVSVTAGTGTATIVNGNIVIFQTPGTVTLNANSARTGTTYAAATVSYAVTIQSGPLVFLAGSGSVSSLSYSGSMATTAVAGGGIGAAIDSGDNLWTLNSGGGGVTTFTPAGALGNSYTGIGLSGATALAIDGSSKVVIANGNGKTETLSNAGAVVSTTQGSTSAGGSGVAIDLSGSVWVTNPSTNSVDEIVGGATPVTPLANAVSAGTPATRP